MGKKHKHEYVARIPRSVYGGIRAQYGRSRTPRTRWGAKWLEYMESLSMGARLGRGRNYAMSGQVFDLEIMPGLIVARVQGVEKEPYTCRIECETVADGDRDELVRGLKERPMLLAQLLARKLPLSVETLFRKAGCPLLPTLERGLLPHCTCPDPSHYCKHIAAVFFLLAEAIEQDPMLLVEMRGITGDDLFGDQAVQEVAAPVSCGQKHRVDDRHRFPPDFWGVASVAKPDYGPAPERGSDPMPLVKRLGPVRFWRGESRFLETLERCGERAVEAGWRTWECNPRERIFRQPEGTPM